MVAATQLGGMIDEKNEFNPCGDVISKPVCTDDQFVNNCCFNGGE